MFHGTFLFLGVGRQLKYYEHQKSSTTQESGRGAIRALLPRAHLSWREAACSSNLAAVAGNIFIAARSCSDVSFNFAIPKHHATR
jgi:hypothetical protein